MSINFLGYETKENEKIDNENNSESSHGPKKISFRARYWGYLFDNLKRAVDEIYATCQSDSSVVECKVSINIFTYLFYLNKTVQSSNYLNFFVIYWEVASL